VLRPSRGSAGAACRRARLPAELGINGVSPETAESVGRNLREKTGASFALALLFELGLDCLRRHLLRLPVDERFDFERALDPTFGTRSQSFEDARLGAQNRAVDLYGAQACPARMLFAK
jgi:hypothetical protein